MYVTALSLMLYWILTSHSDLERSAKTAATADNAILIETITETGTTDGSGEGQDRHTTDLGESLKATLMHRVGTNENEKERDDMVVVETTPAMTEEAGAVIAVMIEDNLEEMMIDRHEGTEIYSTMVEEVVVATEKEVREAAVEVVVIRLQPTGTLHRRPENRKSLHQI